MADSNLQIFLSVLVALLPVALILFLFYKKVDAGPKEPLFHLFLAFAAGLPVAFFTYFAEQYIDGLIYSYVWDVLTPIAISFLEVSLIEEGLKWLPLFFIFRKWAKWDEYSDAVMYALCIGMGFAAVEAFIYGLDGSIGISILRAFTAVPAHAIFAVAMGFFMSRYHFEKKPIFLVMSFLLPFLLHGFYDFFIIQNYHEWLMILALVVLIGSLILAIHLVTQMKRVDL